jgi:hypothetical protein
MKWKWLVLLEIKEQDFLNLSKIIRSDKKFIVTKEDGNYYLSSSHLESLTDRSDVYKCATDILQRISNIVMLHYPGTPPVTSVTIDQIDVDGKRKSLTALSINAYIDQSKIELQL